MRSHKARLAAILQLALAAARFPHLRLGQLIVNVLPKGYEHDAFYIPDAELARLLKEYR